MLVLLASPRWLWYPGEYLLVSYSMIFCMEPEYIRQDISPTWEKLIKPTYRAHLFHQVSCTLNKVTVFSSCTVPLSLFDQIHYSEELNRILLWVHVHVHNS